MGGHHFFKDIITIDCNYTHPGYAAAFLIIEDDRAALVETNTANAAPIILETMKKQDVEPDALEFIIVTHAHLDHAGGASRLTQACPNAKIIAHPRTARHLADPARLIAGTRAVYGDEQYDKLYGAIGPIDGKRILQIEDGESIHFGKRLFTFIHTSGHARHHICMYDRVTNAIFTGDAFGLAYPFLQKGTKPFIFPSTSPVDFSPEEAKLGIYRIMDTGANTAYLTHFGRYNDLELLADMMYTHLQKIEGMGEEAHALGIHGEELSSFCFKAMEEYCISELQSRGISYTPEIRNFLSPDISMNASGLVHWVNKFFIERKI